MVRLETPVSEDGEAAAERDCGISEERPSSAGRELSPLTDRGLHLVTTVWLNRQSRTLEHQRDAHIMSIDVEDYFMVEAFAGSVSRKAWASQPHEVE